MTTDLPVKFKGTAYREYDVYLDGVKIGAVRHREKRYNLRRLIVDRYWTASGSGPAAGFVAVQQELSGGPVRFALRADAAQALAHFARANTKAKADG